MHVYASVYICLICVCMCVCVYIYIYLQIYILNTYIKIYMFFTCKGSWWLPSKENIPPSKKDRSKIEHDKSRTRTKITRRNNTLNLFKPFNFGTTWFWSLSIYESNDQIWSILFFFLEYMIKQIHGNKEIVPIFLCRFKDSSLVDLKEIISLKFYFKYRMHHKIKQYFWEFYQ